jgi:hypothetical protein
MIPTFGLTDKLYDVGNPTELYSCLYLRHIWKRVHEQHFNFLAIITGKHRTGKSMGALSFAHALDPTFLDSMEDRIVYYANDFLNQVNELRKKKIVGGVIVFDEAGVGYGSRDWYQESNKAVGGAMQIVGRYQPIVFFVSQDIKLIDSQIRKYFHGFYEMSRSSNEYAFCRPYGVSQDKKSGKIYHLYSRYSFPNGDAVGSRLRMVGIKIKLPPKDIIKRYESHSKAFKDYILQQMMERTETLEGKKRAEENQMKDSDILAKLVEDKEKPEALNKTSRPDNVIYDPDYIRFTYGVTDSKARYLKKRAEILANKDNEISEDESEDS